ncbi:MAG: restriction endonuclease [Bacteroidetes bacterium]|nr:restriction endonuclease [Bacteroidota bacterium]
MAEFTNTLYYGDNLDILRKMSVDKDFLLQTGGGIDLIYIDPPFNSNRKYNMPYEDMLREVSDKDKYKAQKEAFNDTWSNIEFKQELEDLKGLVDCYQLYNFLSSNEKVFTFPQMSYLTMMAHRLYYIHKVLKDTGSFYLHCDPTMSHYLKILLDMIFGLNNFVNEIVWCYKSGGASDKRFAKKHDVIFLYSKVPEQHTFNVIKEKSYKGIGYRTGNKKVELYDDNDGKGPYTLTYPKDWWQIPMMATSSKQRLNYPTQKPDALLERIIKASSNEGDIVADFFCGCGTAIAAAEKLNRKWIGVDINHLVISLIEEKRLKPIIADKKESKYQIIGFPKDIAGAEKLAKDNKYKFEQWVVEHIFKGHQTKRTGDKGIDGYIAYNFHNTETKSIKKMLAIIEVKGGNVNISQIRAFKNSIENDFKADFGLFIAFDKYITDGMRKEANDLGFVNTDDLDISTLQFARLKKMYIITIDDILKEVLPQELQQIVNNITY